MNEPYPFLDAGCDRQLIWQVSAFDLNVYEENPIDKVYETTQAYESERDCSCISRFIKRIRSTVKSYFTSLSLRQVILNDTYAAFKKFHFTVSCDKSGFTKKGMIRTFEFLKIVLRHATNLLAGRKPKHFPFLRECACRRFSDGIYIVATKRES
ncbi:uncharacterized protein LOC119636274 [Glossina fuscipes]|uniref:Uncharacterized protein LOC119636274 n=1 Tax=Glossina fuscipes TaxID=7396 RepID=A0A9C5YVU7_9MUSC|nr:uncharacterized protein LOC119636274 [Glossina fuscipes]